MVRAGVAPSKLALGATSGPVCLRSERSQDALGSRNARVSVLRWRYLKRAPYFPRVTPKGNTTLTFPGQTLFNIFLIAGVVLIPNNCKSAIEPIKMIIGFFKLRLR